MEAGLKQGVKEFIIAGKMAERSNLLIAAADNYFKALIHAIDFHLADTMGKIPDNHTERFRMLENENKELYGIVDELFKLYRKSYRASVTKDEFMRIKNGLKKTLDITGLKEEVSGYL